MESKSGMSYVFVGLANISATSKNIDKIQLISKIFIKLSSSIKYVNYIIEKRKSIDIVSQIAFLTLKC